MTSYLSKEWDSYPLGTQIQKVSESITLLDQKLDQQWYVGLQNIVGRDGRATPDLIRGQVEYRTAKKRFRSGDVLISRIRTNLNKIWVADRDGVCSSELFVLRPKETLDSQYLFHFFRTQHFIELAVKLQQGVTIPRISFNSLSAVSIPIPTLDKQRAIADLLGIIDEVRYSAQKLDVQISSLLASIFNTFFSNENIGSATRTSLVKLSEISDIKLGTRANFIRDGVLVKCLAQDDIVQGFLGNGKSDEHQAFISQSEFFEKSVQKGDVLLIQSTSNSGVLGRSEVWQGGHSAIVTGKIFCIRLKRDLISPEFLSGYINSTFGRSYFQLKGKNTGNFYEIPVNHMRNMEIPIPSEDIQYSYSKLYQEIHALKEFNWRRLNYLHVLYQSLAREILLGSKESAEDIIRQFQEFNIIESHPLPSTNTRPVLGKLKESQKKVWEFALKLPDPFTVASFRGFLRNQGIVIGSNPGFPSSDEALRRTLHFLVNIGALIAEPEGDLMKWRRPDPENDIDDVEV